MAEGSVYKDSLAQQVGGEGSPWKRKVGKHDFGGSYMTEVRVQ